MRDCATYREKAAHFRKMAREADEKSAAELIAIAEEYEQLALRLEAQPRMPPAE